MNTGYSLSILLKAIIFGLGSNNTGLNIFVTFTPSSVLSQLVTIPEGFIFLPSTYKL